jgi:hypothetical protein
MNIISKIVGCGDLWLKSHHSRGWARTVILNSVLAGTTQWDAVSEKQKLIIKEGHETKEELIELENEEGEEEEEENGRKGWEYSICKCEHVIVKAFGAINMCYQRFTFQHTIKTKTSVHGCRINMQKKSPPLKILADIMKIRGLARWLTCHQAS